MSNLELLSRILIDPNICFGKPCIKGHRIWVPLILDFLASGKTIPEILAEYPQLESEDILACIAYGSKAEQTINPDWISAPGETIADLIEEQQWDQIDLADRLGYNSEQLNQLLSGQMPIVQETALRLENTLGSSSNFWLNREAQYRAKLAQQSSE
jgi:addiction module HigA family antidote